MMGSKTIGYPSAGALGCVTVAFIAGIGWKRQEKKLTPKQLEAYETVSFSFFFIFVFGSYTILMVFYVSTIFSIFFLFIYLCQQWPNLVKVYKSHGQFVTVF